MALVDCMIDPGLIGLVGRDVQSRLTLEWIGVDVSYEMMVERIMTEVDRQLFLHVCNQFMLQLYCRSSNVWSHLCGVELDIVFSHLTYLSHYPKIGHVVEEENASD